ncbi:MULTISPECIES: phosphatase PAP2 family protein [unclassified Myroides]|uniref:phosphatase PAP2 family protein n=1 Tax=unclassified Myroides TaxID=2642485 RepID=UPI003D2F75D0
MKKTAQLVSYLFHPILLPLQTVGLYFLIQYYYFTPLELSIILSQVAIVTFFIPISIYYFMRSLRILKSSVMVSETKERIFPFAINIALLYALKSLVLYNNSAYELKLYFWGLLVTYSLLLIGAIFKQKYSVHTALLTAGLAFFTLLLIQQKTPALILLIVCILITGLTASARLYLKAHTSYEVFIGALLGFLPQLGCWYLLTQ